MLPKWTNPKKSCRINFWYFALTDLYLYLAALMVFCTPCGQQFLHDCQIEMILKLFKAVFFGKIVYESGSKFNRNFFRFSHENSSAKFLPFPENFLTFFQNFLVGKFFPKKIFLGQKLDYSSK